MKDEKKKLNKNCIIYLKRALESLLMKMWSNLSQTMLRKNIAYYTYIYIVNI